MSTIQELRNEIEALITNPNLKTNYLQILALLGKITVHLEALERLYFNQDMKVTAIQNKLDKGGKVEINVRYSEET